MIFTAVLKPVEDYPNAAYIDVPDEIVNKLGKKGRIKVLAKFNEIQYRGSILKMGTPFYILVVLKEIREKLGKKVGDVIIVDLELDKEERIIDIPEDLKLAITSEFISDAVFRNLSYTHQKELVNWLLSAKKEETKQKRIKKIVELLYLKSVN